MQVDAAEALPLLPPSPPVPPPVPPPPVPPDRVIRSIEANNGVLTTALAREIPALSREAVWNAVKAALKEAFQDGPSGDIVGKYRPQRPA